MVEIRQFDGSVEEISQFVISSWDATYATKMPVPRWSADYFRWQLRLHEAGSQQRIVAAYEGQQLAGLLAYFPTRFELHGQSIEAAQGSWLSVSQQFRGKGIAAKLQDSLRSQLRADQQKFVLGFGYFGSRRSLGVRFWKKNKNQTTTFARKVGFWARVLDAERAGVWNVNGWESQLTKLAAPVTFSPKVKTQDGLVIREVDRADLPRCLELALRSTENCDLRIHWGEAHLAHHLGCEDTISSTQHQYGQGLVAEVDGIVQGCIGFHLLPIQGKTLETVGVIDLMFLDGLSSINQGKLLNSVLLKLKNEGAVVALKLRTGDYPAKTFMRWGWFPKPVDSHVLLTWADQLETLPKLRRLHVLWR